MDVGSVWLADRAVYFEELDVLAVADLHLGRTRIQPGRDYPEPEYKSISSRLTALIDLFNPTELVLNGDTFNHVVPPQEAQETATSIVDYARENGCSTVVFTVGNHEEDVANLESFVPEGGRAVTGYSREGQYFFHGDHTPTETAETFIIGHIHPEVTQGSVQLPCYLYGRNAVYGTDLLVLPAFSSFVGGHSITDADGTRFAGISPPIADADIPLTEFSVAATPRTSTRAETAFR